MTHRPLPFLRAELDSLREKHQLRQPRDRTGQQSFASNDYLGLGRADALEDSDAPWASTGSRLISGDHQAVRRLEADLATWLELPKALVFTSGYAANLGSLAALTGPDDLVFSDALNHASLIDGVRLGKAPVRVFPHNDLEALARLLEETPRRRRWVVTESYFSMDADGPDLRALRALCDRADALLYLDEAHALGVAGPRGRGLAAAAGVVPDVFAATLGKSLAAQGAFVAGAEELYGFLWNKARSFVFSTGISPAVAEHARQNLTRLERADDARARLEARALAFRARLRAGGLEPLGQGPLVPIVFGDETAALAIGERMAERGFHVQPIRPPTVPAGTSRLRVTLSALETDAQVDALADALIASR